MTKGSKWFRDTTSDRRQRVAQLHAAGLSNSIIARRLGIADTTVSQDLLALGLRKPKTTATVKTPLPEAQAAMHGIDLAELLTPHGLAKLRLIELQALFLDGMKKGERGRMTGRSAAFTFAELSRDQLITAVLRQHENPAPAYPRLPAAGSAPAPNPPGQRALSASARTPGAGAPAGAGGLVEGTARPALPDLRAGGATGDAAPPEPARKLTSVERITLVVLTKDCPHCGVKKLNRCRSIAPSRRLLTTPHLARLALIPAGTTTVSALQQRAS